jgi:hypothetical protein
MWAQQQYALQPSQFRKSRRLGASLKPSAALLSRHIEYLDATLEQRYHAATSVVLRLELVSAGLDNFTAWLAWLRSMELYSLCWLDVENVAPSDGPNYDLPIGTGILLLRLLEKKKSVQTSTADVVIAGTSWSGFSPQRWLNCLSNLLGAPLLFP